MRLAILAVILCLALLAFGLRPVAAQPAAPQDESADAAASQSEAAEKHAKRTECLKDAKSRKLVGAQRAAFVKDCMASTLAPDSQASASAAAP